MDLRESALIEVAGHNLNQWAKKGPNFRFFPSFIAKNGQKNPRTKCGGVLVRVQERLFFPSFTEKWLHTDSRMVGLFLGS